MTTNRHVRCGEELTFDYYSITTSDVEWRAAVCLCGMASCRGSFLAYATQDDLQQVLNQNFGPVSRYASLLRACADRKASTEDTMTLARHGIKQAILGSHPPNWMIKYAADILRFIEFERKALPCSLLRPRGGFSTEYTFGGADMDARCVMEQRIQSMVCCVSMINRVLMGQPSTWDASSESTPSTNELKPLKPILARQVMELVWSRLCKIPSLINSHMLCPSDKTPEVKAIKTKKSEVESLLAEISPLLQEMPTSMAAVRETCVKIRKVLLKYKHLSYAKARLMQLADVLALWAFTVNFSVPQEYEVVEAAPIDVPARELGSTVPRSVLEKARIKEREKDQYQRRKERRQLAQLEYQLYDDLGLKKKSKKLSPSSVTANTSASDLPGLSETRAVIITQDSASTMDEDEPLTSNSADSITTDSPATVPTNEAVVQAMDVDQDESGDHLPVQSTDLNILPEVIKQEPVSEGVSAVTFSAPKEEEELTSVKPQHTPTKVKIEEEETTEESLVTDDAPLAGSSNSKPQASSNSRHTSLYLDPNESVFAGRKVYDKWFCFWQLIGWFNAGSDQKAENPDVFGCVELPDPVACFGNSATMYSAKHQEMLINILKDDKLQAMHWPTALKSTFNLEQQMALQQSGECVYGSPMLDVVLGQIDSVAKAVREIISTAECAVDSVDKNKNRTKKVSGNSGSNNKRRSLVEDEDRQLDEILAPEAPTNWVQCDGCHKWRRVPWHVDLEALPDPWTCVQNTWDVDAATCEAPQDAYDASKENAMYDEQENSFVLADFVPGSWWDVFCTKNLVYYEGQVLRSRQPTGKKKNQSVEILIHYKGWSNKFNEWIPFDSDRFVRHNLFTNPMASDPREQERWQGMQPVTSVIKSAFKNLPKKRKSEDGESGPQDKVRSPSSAKKAKTLKDTISN
jgi:hypothetical protein